MADEKQGATAAYDAFRDTYGDQINSPVSCSGKAHDFFTKMAALYLKDLLYGTCPGAERTDALDTGPAENGRRFIAFAPFGNALFAGIDRKLRWLQLGAQ